MTELNKRAQSMSAFYGDESFRDLADDSMLQDIDELIEYPEEEEDDEDNSFNVSINEGNTAGQSEQAKKKFRPLSMNRRFKSFQKITEHSESKEDDSGYYNVDQIDAPIEYNKDFHEPLDSLGSDMVERDRVNGIVAEK